jgi:RNA polymerase sigma-70 factor (sigma-E family)
VRLLDMAGTRPQPSPPPDRLGPPTAVEKGRRPGRDEAIDVLFRAQYATLLRLAFCLLGERAPAEDAVQDAFVSAYTHWTGLRDPDAAPAYLRSAVINRCRSRLRDKVRRSSRPALVLVETSETSSEDVVVARTERSRLAGAVSGLPQRQREVVVCRYYLELSVIETAELLGIATGSVKRHAHRGVQALSQRLGEVTT